MPQNTIGLASLTLDKHGNRFEILASAAQTIPVSVAASPPDGFVIATHFYIRPKTPI